MISIIGVDCVKIFYSGCLGERSAADAAVSGLRGRQRSRLLLQSVAGHLLGHSGWLRVIPRRCSRLHGYG
jgi:hypothetical protein